jgi:hypothetical protein
MATLTEHPPARFTHDCSQCVYLGHYQEFDLYFHDGGEHAIRTTVIARYSSAGPDYLSGMGFAVPFRDASGEMSSGIPVLVEARYRAIERGLLLL